MARRPSAARKRLPWALGDPLRLARELRAEAGFRRWEQSRTPANFFTAVFGFVVLIAVDFIFLLPLLACLTLFTLIAGDQGEECQAG